MPITIDTRGRSRTRRGRGSTSVRRNKRGRSFKAHIRRPLALKMHNFVERLPDVKLSLNSSTLSADGNLLSTHTNTFQISDVPQIASYALLFEYYKIDKMVIEYRYRCAGIVGQQKETGGGATATPYQTMFQSINPLLYFKVDHNDDVSQTVGDLLQSARTREKQLTDANPSFTITLKPAVQAEAYKSLTASTYIPKWNQWLSLDDTTVPHYGLKTQIQCPSPSPEFDFGSLLIQKKMYFSVKNNE